MSNGGSSSSKVTTATEVDHVAVRQAASSLLAAQVRNTDSISSLFSVLSSLNKDINDAMDASDVALKINEKLDDMRSTVTAVTGKQQSLEKIFEGLNDDITKLLKKLKPLDSVVQRIQAVETGVQKVMDKAGEVDIIMQRIEKLEKELKDATRQERSGPAPASKKKRN